MTDARDQFIEQMGAILQAEGMPRIAGQILGFLIVEGAPRTLGQMTEALRISKGSASTNARLLERIGSVRRVSVLGQRQDSYEMVEEPELQTLAGMSQRFRANAAAVEAVATGFAPGEEAARERVAHVAEFYRQGAVFVDEWMERVRTAAPAPAGREGDDNGQ